MPSSNGRGGPAGEAGQERVALYLRVSSEEQRDRETIEIQREFLGQFRDLYGLEVAEITRMMACRERSPCMSVPRVEGSLRTPERGSSARFYSTSSTVWAGPCSSLWMRTTG